ncbi:MAG: ABC transporter permease [Candidatus Atribacteria bacterium]|nr:ABC transporter permease [Candidatus Atribacteria bacterium]
MLLKVKKQKARSINTTEFIVYIAFLAIFIFFSIVLRGRGFLSSENLMNIARQTAMISVMAVGMTFVLAAGEIDLSIGSIVALASLTTALALRHSTLLVGVGVGLGTGVLIGMVNGLFVAKIGVPSFLVTLGMTGIITGLARWITQLKSIPVTNKTYNFLFGSGDIGPISILFIWTIVLLILGQITLRKTRFGRYVLATGGNKISALYSGINVDRIKFSVMALNGTLAALAGMLYAGRLHGARYTLGETDLMTVIAAVIIGGTSLSGGRGSVVGSVVGSLIMGMINNGLILMGLSVDQQMIFRGLIIIIAVSFTMREKKK